MIKMIEELCDRIIEHEEFKKDYMWASTNSARIQLDKKGEDCIDDYHSDIILKLLQCATTFSLSNRVSIRKTAYNIAINCHNINFKRNTDDTVFINSLIALVLSRLGNFPAENKFLKENNMSNDYELPQSLWFEKEVHQEDNTVNILGDYNIVLTDFQLQLWESVKEHTVSIVNAPTSAGKSFILQNHIVHALNSGAQNALYIVPTRALIEQVVNDFRNILKTTNSLEMSVTEVPHYENSEQRHIFVLTQERVQLLLEEDVSLDLVVVDEAQNVSDNARGIILQSVIEQIKNTCVNVKFVFATPYVKNPGVFLSMFGFRDILSNIIPMAEAPVSQNLFSVNVEINDAHKVEISKMNDEGKFNHVCSIFPEYELVDERKYLAVLATEIGAGQNNIIYGNDPSVCENIASLIAQALSCETTEDKLDVELKDFSNYLKEHIHKDYLLAETIKYGVAYHYGNLPSFIRKGIERLCTSGKIKYIVCTSTLLQGVNLPAQNIFIMKPTKGHDKNKKAIPLNAPDFWNLAGRAGRLTKDFEGNIFLINLHDWEVNPLNSKERMTTITPSFKSYVCSPESGLLDFISDREHRSGQKETQGLENAFMKLLMLNSEGSLCETLDAFAESIDEQHKQMIISAIELATKEITIPYELYSKNPNVSVFRQQKLYDTFKNVTPGNLRNFIPPHPMHQFSTIKERYIKLFQMYENYLVNSKAKSYLYFYWIALDWMRGDSYFDLLKVRIDHSNSKRKRGSANVNTEARGLFDDIESNVRFKYVKFSKCYNDILSYILKEQGLEEAISSIPPLHLYLELGASSTTMINLIGMGISRTVASQISKVMLNSAMTTEEIHAWLKKQNLYALNLPNNVIAELEEVL